VPNKEWDVESSQDRSGEDARLDDGDAG
jgi:hypothetical protein